jgi:hypothetical protein
VIHYVIDQVVSELNDYIQIRTGVEQKPVMAGSLVKPDGQPDPRNGDKLLLNVVNVEADRVYHSVETFAKRSDATIALVKPDVRVNLYLLFVGNYGQYSEALKAISLVIAFFQHRTAFDYSAITGLEGKTGKVTFEMMSPTFEQQNHLWGALGAKYLPCVLYKAGLIDISDEVTEGVTAPMRDMGTQTR